MGAIVRITSAPATFRQIGRAVEDDFALPIGQFQSAVFLVANETDLATGFGRRKNRAITFSSEADSSRPIVRLQPLGTAVETDAAMPVSVGGGIGQFLTGPSPLTGSEGRTYLLTVTASQTFAQAVSIPYTVTDGAAVYGSDYIVAREDGTQPASQGGGVRAGALILAAGETSVSLYVAMLGDGSTEGSQAFTAFFNLNGATFV